MPPLAWDQVLGSALAGALTGLVFYLVSRTEPITVRERDRLEAFFAEPRRNAMLMGLAMLGIATLWHDATTWAGWTSIDRMTIYFLAAGLWAGQVALMRYRFRLVGRLQP